MPTPWLHANRIVSMLSPKASGTKKIGMALREKQRKTNLLPSEQGDRALVDESPLYAFSVAPHCWTAVNLPYPCWRLEWSKPCYPHPSAC